MERHPHDDDVDLAIMRIVWRLEALDDWREIVERRLGELGQEVTQLIEADKLAEALAQRMAQTQAAQLQVGALGLTRRQSWTAVVGVCVTAAGLLVNALHAAGVF